MFIACTVVFDEEYFPFHSSIANMHTHKGSLEMSLIASPTGSSQSPSQAPSSPPLPLPVYHHHQSVPL